MKPANSSTSGVSSGSVLPGEKFVVRTSYTNDSQSSSQDNRIRIRQHYEHGFNEGYALRFIVSQDKRKNNSLQHQSFRVENRFQFFEENSDGFNGAIRLGYRNNKSSADKVEVRFNGSKKIADNWQYRQNIILGHEVFNDSESGINLETRFAVQTKVTQYNIGIDLFNDWGNLKQLSSYSSQQHTFGSYLKGNINNNLSYEAGYRHGISKSAGDNSVRLFLEYGF